MFSILLFYSTVFFHFAEQINDDDDDDDDDDTQEAQLSQTGRAMLRVIESFAKSLKVIRNDTLQWGMCMSLSRTVS